jgi:hypothetical protein
MPTTLYRPVGLDELALIWDARCREFPPRLSSFKNTLQNRFNIDIFVPPIIQ